MLSLDLDRISSANKWQTLVRMIINFILVFWAIFLWKIPREYLEYQLLVCLRDSSNMIHHCYAIEYLMNSLTDFLSFHSSPNQLDNLPWRNVIYCQARTERGIVWLGYNRSESFIHRVEFKKVDSWFVGASLDLFVYDYGWHHDGR